MCENVKLFCQLLASFRERGRSIRVGVGEHQPRFTGRSRQGWILVPWPCPQWARAEGKTWGEREKWVGFLSVWIRSESRSLVGKVSLMNRKGCCHCISPCLMCAITPPPLRNVYISITMFCVQGKLSKRMNNRVLLPFWKGKNSNRKPTAAWQNAHEFALS